MNDGLTHFVGDTCEGGHKPTLVDRLRWLDESADCACFDGDRTRCPSWIARDALVRIEALEAHAREKDANILELIETLQRTEAGQQNQHSSPQSVKENETNV